MGKKRLAAVRQHQLDGVSALGFTFKYDAQIKPVSFLNQNFRGLALLRLSREVKSLLEPLASTQVHAQWQLTEPPPVIALLYSSDDGFVEDTGVVLSRRFERNESGLEVYHEYFSLPREHRGKKIGRKILKDFFLQYERMGVRKIKVHATLRDGGYAWARAGFRAVRKTEVDRILGKARQQLSGEELETVEGIYNDHYNNFYGQPFPIEYWARLDYMENLLRGSSWHGEIDLTNSFEFDNFNDYVSRP